MQRSFDTFLLRKNTQDERERDTPSLRIKLRRTDGMIFRSKGGPPHIIARVDEKPKITIVEYSK